MGFVLDRDKGADFATDAHAVESLRDVIKESLRDAKHGGDIEVVNSTIESAGSAITIQGSGDVSLSGATVTGQKTAVLIQGSGNVSAKDTRFQGKKVVQGTGEYEDRGGNSWKK